jgi:hypothetical protein
MEPYYINELIDPELIDPEEDLPGTLPAGGDKLL